MRDELTVNTLRALRTRAQLDAFAARLGDLLKQDDEERTVDFGESRAKALLRAANLTDDATLADFAHTVDRDASVRGALYDLLQDTGLAAETEVRDLVHLSAAGEPQPTMWLSLVVAAYAWRIGYPLGGLDPATPPNPNTPAGQLLRRSAHFLRRQVQRSATERDKLDRQLSQPPTGAPSLDELQSSPEAVAPLPPHYRPPIPVNYPEMNSETLQVDADEAVAPPEITVGDPLVISPEEVDGHVDDSRSEEPVRMPAITIDRDQVAPNATTPPSPMPASAVVMPTASTDAPSRPGLTVSLRQMFGQEQLASTKLRVLVQQYPDGPGLYGLQVRVTCKGVKSYVAGTTDRDGKFVCELPVRIQSGLTYDVDVTWPREEGGETERKSITLHADRTYFVLPFYRRLSSPEEE